MVKENIPNSRTGKFVDLVEKKVDFFIRNTIFSLCTICGIALLIRFYYFPVDIPITLDALQYFWYAIDTRILGHLPTDYAIGNNGWPIFLSVFFYFFHSNDFMDYMILQRLVSVALSVLTIIPVYLLCKRFFDSPYTLFGTATFAFEPHIIQNSLLGITESLYILLGTISLCLFLSSDKKLTYCSFAVISLATIARAEGIFLFLAISILFFVRYRKEKMLAAKYAIAGIIFVLILLPMALIRVEIVGADAISSRILNAPAEIALTSQSTSLLQFIGESLGNSIMFLGRALLPNMIFFAPVGFLLILKNRNEQTVTIITILVCMFIPALYAYSVKVFDTRYLFFEYPLFSVLATFAVLYYSGRFRNRNIFLILVISGILFSSILYLDLKKIDLEHEKEALSLAFHVSNTTSGINPYLLESRYLAIPTISDQNFPVLSNTIPVKPKLIATTGFNSLEEYIKIGKEHGLTHLVLDGKENSKYRSYFLNDIFYHEEKYPYLTKVYDSLDHGYKYHLKIYKIDYERFDSITK